MTKKAITGFDFATFQSQLISDIQSGKPLMGTEGKSLEICLLLKMSLTSLSEFDICPRFWQLILVIQTRPGLFSRLKDLEAQAI
jgi:hypothetical protein